MNHTESIKRRKDQEIPFGIRAIESGIEVDGVWISRPNTPTRSSPEITSFSSIQEPMSSDNLHPPCRSSSTYSIPRLELPQPVHGYSDATQSRSRIASGAPGSHHERGVSAERWPNRDISPGSDYTRGSRPTYEPRRSSHLRYSNPHLLSDPTTLDALEGRELRTNFSSQSSEGKTAFSIWTGSGWKRQARSADATLDQELTKTTQIIIAPTHQKKRLTRQAITSLSDLISHDFVLQLLALRQYI